MKHLPNLITLANLFFGCCAIVFTLTSYPYFTVVGTEGQYMQIQGMDKMYLGSLFIGLAAVMDMLDGMAARLLKVSGPIGKDLDSLADVVSFGVAPGVILYQLLWRAYMMEPNAMQTSFWVTAPALLLPCFAAYRLAKFNNTGQDFKGYFLGMPTPAAGISIAVLPLILFFEYDIIGKYLEYRAVLYILIAVLCYLMVSPIKFLKWNSGKGGFSGFWPQLVIIGGALISMLFIGFGGLLVGVFLYIVCSLIYKYPAHLNDTTPETAEI